MIELLRPPFDTSPHDPGYIRGYVPGVRENGGQYTHAAVWAVMAFAQAGRTERAWELFDMINPVRHGNSAAAIGTWMVEPYVVTADVLAVAPHVGRGGWSWYTGAAGWMYRLITESLLGLHREGHELAFAPRLPKAWPGLAIEYRYGDSVYAIEVRREEGAVALRVLHNGVEQAQPRVALQSGEATQRVEVIVGDV